MSLTQDRGNHVFQCEGCGETLDTETSNFDSARNLMQRSGWAARRAGAEWVHYCSTECLNEARRAQHNQRNMRV